MNELQLIKKCIEGKSKAQQELYEQYAPKMMGVCMRYTADVETARDVLQEAFITVFTQLRTYKGEGSFAGWIRRIVVNTALMSIRKTTLFADYESLDNHQHVVSVQPTTLEELSASDLMQMIESLPMGLRTVFNLYAVEGYSHQEIGELLSISEGGARSQYCRARKQLQELIIAEYGESFRKRSFR